MRTLTLLFAALSFSSCDAFGPRRRPRNIHAAKLSTPYIDKQDAHERLLAGAGCEVPTAPQITAPKENVWRGITATEFFDISKWVSKHLNVTGGYTDKVGVDFVEDIELMVPNKTNVLEYFDNGGKRPDRYASVLIFRGSKKVPSYDYILVGPLPASNTTTWQPMTYPFTRKTPIRALFGRLNYRQYEHFHNNITNAVKDITLDLFKTNKTNSYSGQTPYWQYDNKITEWNQFWGQSHGGQYVDYLLPLGLYYKCTYDLYGEDPSSWKFEGWLYNDIYYETTEEFRKAYFSPGFEKFGPNVQGAWTNTDQQGPILPLDDEPPPMPIAKRARFKVDSFNKYVEWMGFSFYMNIGDGGLSLYDVRFKGERIIYELSLQKAMGHYAGNDPVQSGTAYLESIGAEELVPGYDCPTYATYLNTSYSYASYREVATNSICIFEFDADYPIQRHAFQSNTKNIYLVVRAVSTIGNYDYNLSYMLFMDGSMEVVLRAAGYIQSAYFAKNEDYGYHIHDFLSGSMHDHVLNFKADFDILGTENTMQLVTVTAATVNYTWSDQPRNTMKLVRKELQTEDESRLFWSGNGDTQYRIVNKSKRNKYGEYRGYRILPSQGTVHLAATNSSNIGYAANWAYHDLAISKRKDTEPWSHSYLNENDIYNPLINFYDYFDGESLDQEDLVLWFNLGMHHIPHTGDLPNTVYTTAHSAIQITPSNFYDRDQSRDTVNMVSLIYNGRGDTTVKTFGQAHQICAANLSTLDAYGY